MFIVIINKILFITESENITLSHISNDKYTSNEQSEIKYELKKMYWDVIKYQSDH